MSVRPAAPGDPVGEVLLASFDRPSVAQLARLLEERTFGVTLVEEVDGKVLGYVRLSRGWVDAPDRVVEVLVLSPLAVLAAHRGKGLGGDLVRAALHAADGMGEPLVFLEGDPAYYGPLGFTSATALGFTAPSVRIPEPAFQVATLTSYDASMTGALVYADPFWSTDSVGQRS